MLLAIIPVVPLIGALILFLKRDNGFINIPFVTSGAALILSVFALKNVSGGTILYFKFPVNGPFVPSFRADLLSAVFIFLSAFLWLVVSLYSPGYMKHEGRGKVFEISTLFTFASVLGGFLAADLLTLLLFFELMTVSSFFWVIHKWDKEAIKAGYFYLFYSITGGLFIALGIVLKNSGTEMQTAWSIILFVAGFGIKAGMAPLHLWLPHAHSVAPTPGSALLSGLLIKVGAYGLIRVGQLAGWGTNLTMGFPWLGVALIVLGTITMLTGVLAALIQSHAKRLLAYHSISQMGYIILGLGLGLYMGGDGSLGLIGAVYHIVNHALFKVALFLGVGIIYIHTKETDLYKLGGLWRRFPLTAVLMLVAVLGITGAPGLNGYASKTILHHAVSQAAETGQPWMIWVERVFSVVGIGTAASFSKLYYLIFLGKPSNIKEKSAEVKEVKFSSGLHLAMGLLAAVMIGIGIKPELLPGTVIVPAAEKLGMENASLVLNNLFFWNMSDIISMIITLMLGMIVCWAGLKSRIFHWHPPAWITIEGLGRIAFAGISAVWQKAIKCYQTFTVFVQDTAKGLINRTVMAFQSPDKPRGAAGKVRLAGISADAAVLIMAFILLVIWYTLMHLKP
ncbi:MAG: proton-conducting membrane transporter [Clostridiaceae bacterium]|nr:proton-conducting membrane transporter [Clostridiaceae bacterium]